MNRAVGEKKMMNFPFTCNLRHPEAFRLHPEREGQLNEATALLERAARCRDIAEDYHAEVAAPLIELASELEERAQRLQPSLRISGRILAGQTSFKSA